jgi:hypothetical protein
MRVMSQMLSTIDPESGSHVICEKCQQRYEISDWPFCPHGRGAGTVVPDDVPGGFVVENGFSEPRKFYSRSEHERALAAEGLEIRAKNAGPDDKICRPWHTVNLEDAKVLLERGAQARREKQTRWKDASLPITVTDGESFTGKDLKC